MGALPPPDDHRRMKSIKSHLSPSGSMVVAVVALLVAMSGSAVASSLITGKQIKDGTIQKKDLSKSARWAAWRHRSRRRSRTPRPEGRYRSGRRHRQGRYAGQGRPDPLSHRPAQDVLDSR